MDIIIREHFLFFREKMKISLFPDHQGHFHHFGVDIIERIEEAGFEVREERYSITADESDPDNRFFAARKAGAT